MRTQQSTITINKPALVESVICGSPLITKFHWVFYISILVKVFVFVCVIIYLILNKGKGHVVIWTKRKGRIRNFGVNLIF